MKSVFSICYQSWEYNCLSMEIQTDRENEQCSLSVRIMVNDNLRDLLEGSLPLSQSLWSTSFMTRQRLADDIRKKKYEASL